MRSRLAVAVASNRTPELLAACLASLAGPCRRLGAPIAVGRPETGAALAEWQARFPEVRMVSAPDGNIPRLRGAALLACDADLVALTEDHCVVDDDWLDALVTAHGSTGADAVGGGMGNAQPARAVDWAAYFSEYGFFSWTRPPSPGTPLLTGANVAYARSVRAQAGQWAADGDWENVIHDRLAAAGRQLAFAPAARVRQNLTYRLGAFCRDRYEHGRNYARARLAQPGHPSRLVLLAGTPVLVPLLVARVGAAAASIDRGAFLRALPITTLFLGSWVVGEAVGYATPGGAPAAASDTKTGPPGPQVTARTD